MSISCCLGGQFISNLSDVSETCQSDVQIHSREISFQLVSENAANWLMSRRLTWPDSFWMDKWLMRPTDCSHESEAWKWEDGLRMGFKVNQKLLKAVWSYLEIEDVAPAICSPLLCQYLWTAEVWKLNEGDLTSRSGITCLQRRLFGNCGDLKMS